MGKAQSVLKPSAPIQPLLPFPWHKQVGVLLLPSGWDTSLPPLECLGSALRFTMFG